MNYEQFKDHNLENDLLSIFLNDQEVLDEAINISDDIFYLSKNKLLWSVIRALWTNNEDITIATIYANLKNDIDKVGGITGITELHTSYVTSQGYKSIIKALEYLKTRRDIKTLNDSINRLLVEEKDNDEIISIINGSSDKMNNTEEGSNGDLTQALEELSIDIEERINNKGKIKGIPTRLNAIDKRINGLNKQEIIIIAGRPGSGKTTLANNIAINVAEQGKHVVLFNLEMSLMQIVEKMLSNLAMVEMDKIKFGNINGYDMDRLGNGNEKLLRLRDNFKVYDDVLHINQIVAKAKKLKKQNKLDLIIVDYLQLIESDKRDSREQEVASISRRLKLLSKELKVPVIALSQLSRAPEQRADHRPIMSDIRESGAIEQDADIIMFCYRDEYYNPQTEEPNVMEVIVGKNRNGAPGIDKIAWIPEYQKVSNLF